jgi:23S rRNA pseudouridine1911/1915/1917 synthase
VGRQFLHAQRIEFNHPRTGERVAFEAPLPGGGQAAIDGLREY